MKEVKIFSWRNSCQFKSNLQRHRKKFLGYTTFHLFSILYRLTINQIQLEIWVMQYILSCWRKQSVGWRNMEGGHGGANETLPVYPCLFFSLNILCLILEFLPQIFFNMLSGLNYFFITSFSVFVQAFDSGLFLKYHTL